MSEKVRECWASCLGNCEGPLTLEHIASKSIFYGDTFTSHGMHWSKGGITLKTDKIGTHMLCKRHNETTSPLDACAGNLVTAIRKFWKCRRNNSVTIDGRLLERWSVKLVTNMLASGWFFPQKMTPPKSLVEIVFGLREFTEQAGLHNLLMIQHHCVPNNLQFMPLGQMGQGKFSLHGIVFNLESIVFGLFPRDGDHSAMLHKIGKSKIFDFSETKAIHHPALIRLERKSRRCPRRMQTLDVNVLWN